MAATNYTPIQLYFSTTASAVPLAANLAQGELAINIADGKLYYEDSAGIVQVIATKGAGTIGGSTTQIQYNNAGALAGNAAMVFNNSTNVTTLTTLNLTNALGATYGGTAQSAYTQGDVLYASATNTLSKLGIGTVNYILTSTGSVPQWVAPTSVTVQTANNLAGGAAGSVPYQSAPDTTTFLAIGAANRVMTSSGTAPQWVTALTGLTGVSSSSITNTSLTSGRLVYSTTGGAQTDSSNLTFNGTTLSAGGFSTTGLSTLVQTVKIGDSNFSGSAVFAAATPAKLYIGTGTVTDTTSAIGATNAIGAISSLAITPIAATNTSVTYTNASTLYIAGAPSAGTNVTITNPYSLYIAAGAAYFGGSINAGALTVTNLTDSALTSGRVPYASTGGLLVDSANLLYSGTDLTVYGITVGRGAGAVSTNTAVGASALINNSTGVQNTAIGYQAGYVITTGGYNTAVGASIMDQTAGVTGQENMAIGRVNMRFLTSGSYNTAAGNAGLAALTTGSNNSAVGYQALASNTTASYNTAVGYQAGYANTTGTITAVGNQALTNNTTGTVNTGVGNGALYSNTTGGSNTALGVQALLSNTTASYMTAVGYQAYYSHQSGGASGTAIGYQAAFSATVGGVDAFGYRSAYAATTGTYLTAIGSYALTSNTTGSYNVAVGWSALNSNTTASNNTAVGYQAGYNNTTGYNNALFGQNTGASLTTGYANTFIGRAAGEDVTTGTRNTILGRFSGNQGGLDIRTASNYIVLSDGDGNPRLAFDENGQIVKTGTANAFNSTINSVQNFDAASRFGFNGLANNNDGIFFGTGINNGIPSGIAFYREGAGWNTAIGFFTNYVTSGPQSTSAMQQKLLLTSSGALSLFNGDKAPGGTGICFPASQDPSSNANTLDDYEEGTWTPAIRGSGTAGTYTATAVSGSYTKIGNTVTVSGRINGFSVASGGTGYIQLTGLPFQNSATAVCAVRYDYLVVNASTVDVHLEFIGSSGQTTLNFRENYNNGTGLDTPISSISTNTANILFTMTYLANT